MLQGYMTTMTGHVTDPGLRSPTAWPETPDMARALTLATLPRLDGDRRGTALAVPWLDLASPLCYCVSNFP